MLETEPADDVQVRLEYDATQLAVEPNVVTFSHNRWWESREVVVQAIDDERCEVTPQRREIRHVVICEDETYGELVPVVLSVSVVDNEVNLPPTATRVWPKTRTVRTTASRLQVVFEVTAADDGQPGPMALGWDQRVSAGLQSGSVPNTGKPTTTGVFLRTGAYEVVFTATDGRDTAHLDFALQLGAVPGVKAVNFAPLVSAGDDQNIAPNVATMLYGTASDDRLPVEPGALTVQWTKISGPGIVTFGSASNVKTTVMIKTPGRYVLRLTAHDGEVKVYDDVVVTVR